MCICLAMFCYIPITDRVPLDKETSAFNEVVEFAMTVGRSKEEPRTWFRSERVFLVDGRWFFHTREGVDVGPYESQFEAEIEAGMLREFMRDRLGEHSLDVIRDFVLDSYAMGRPLTPNFREALYQQSR